MSVQAAVLQYTRRWMGCRFITVVSIYSLYDISLPFPPFPSLPPLSLSLLPSNGTILLWYQALCFINLNRRLSRVMQVGARSVWVARTGGGCHCIVRVAMLNWPQL